ncbi:MAG: M14 family zinc carboxypeptidase [Pyrinomonadaceae bacterium]
MKIKSLLLAAIFCAAFGQFAFSQSEEKFDFYMRGTYRAEVPRPQQIVPFDVGDFHTNYAQMERVIEAIAKAAPDRVKIFDIGETSEHRMQHVIAISSPENMARLDELKANNQKLTDSRSTNPSQANQIIQTNPVFAWMAYTIHGNESASFEAMMQVVYQLAASNEPQTLDILKNCVTLIVATENPDGHERFVTWYNSVETGNADRNALEHREPWTVYGRLNHFRIDLNRDNIAATQVETRNMQRAFFEWNPQVSADHHGQPSQFFFPPAALPINPNLPQPATNKWLDIFGRANAQNFDKNKWDYYVRDIFDLFYPGYWDSFPSLNGAIGMTYETDGGGFKGINWTRDDGTIATLRSAIAKHFVASMTTLETVAKNRQARLQDFYDFRRTAIEEVAKEKIKRIVIDPQNDAGKAADLIAVLKLAKIEVRWSPTFNLTKAHNYTDKDSPAATKNFAGGAYIVDLAQPQKRIAKALLEPDTPQDAAFVREQTEKFKRNELRGKSQQKEDYGFYDITSWNLPMAFGLDAFWSEDAAQISNTVAVDDAFLAQKKAEKTRLARAEIAYIIPYDQDTAAIAALRLLKQGFRVAFATKTLSAVGTTFPRGTFVVRVTRNPPTIHQAVENLAREFGLAIYSANTGFQDSGDTGVGGENVVSLQNPKIAIIADEGVEQTSYGSLWWTLDRYGVAFTSLTINNIKNGALKNYTILIMPDGSAGRYFSSFGSGGISALKTWINGGGSLITMRGSSVFAALKDVGLTSSKLVGSDDDDDKDKATEDEEVDKRKETETRPTPSPTPAKNKNKQIEADASPTPENRTDKQDWQSPVLPPIASPSANAGKVPEGIPGAILRATIDKTTYLTYGLEQENMPVLLASGYFFRPSKEGANAIVFDQKPKKSLTLSGFVWEGNTERLLKGTAYLIDEPTGGGHVILFAEDPFFRGIFRTMTRPFFNSILFNGTF